MKHLTLATMIFAAAVFFGGISMARPVAVECEQLMTMKIDRATQDALYLLCDDTQKTWFKNDTDRESLKSKVVMAGTKVYQGKFGDAAQKLADYETTLRGLMDASKKKVDGERAQNVLVPDADSSQMALSYLY